jgi:hypothetical protein
MRADVLAYWADHDDFPHQSTADQFFEESQFESYRALGEQITQQAFVGAENFTDGNRLREVFDRAALARLTPPGLAEDAARPVTPPTYRA